jgi:hypothetical protein
MEVVDGNSRNMSAGNGIFQKPSKRRWPVTAPRRRKAWRCFIIQPPSLKLTVTPPFLILNHPNLPSSAASAGSLRSAASVSQPSVATPCCLDQTTSNDLHQTSAQKSFVASSFQQLEAQWPTTPDAIKSRCTAMPATISGRGTARASNALPA